MNLARCMSVIEGIMLSPLNIMVKNSNANWLNNPAFDSNTLTSEDNDLWCGHREDLINDLPVMPFHMRYPREIMV
jgi:hypothetical protein